MMILLSVARALSKGLFSYCCKKVESFHLEFWSKKSVGKLSPEIINSYFLSNMIDFFYSYFSFPS